MPGLPTDRRLPRDLLARANEGQSTLTYYGVVDLLGVLASFFGFVLSATRTARDWLRRDRNVRVSTDEVPGPTTTAHGFTQSSVSVLVANKGGTNVEVQEIRLMFSRKFGFPLKEAPPPRTHPALPTAIETGAARTWYFPAEDVAIVLGNLSPKSTANKGDTKLRARVVTATGSVYTSRRHKFSLDPNDHWL